MRDDPLGRRRFSEQAAIINFPEPQAKRVGGAISLVHRVRHLQRVADDDNRFEAWQQAPPERQGEAITRIFPPQTAFPEKRSINNFALARIG